MRRSLLKTALLSPLAACEGVPAPRPNLEAMPGRKRWIDVHCHVFNAADLPLFEFIQHTKLSGTAGLVAAPILALIAGGSKNDAPTPDAELQMLSGDRAALAPPPSFRQGVERLLAQQSDRAATIGGPTPQQLQDLIHRTLQEARLRRPGVRSSAPSPAELDAIDALPLERSNIGAIVARYFNWGLTFAQPRDVLVGRLAALYPGQQLMMTPAMVDYDLWLGAPNNDLPGQQRVMAAIGVKRARAGLPVHAFVGFDPWRCIRDRARGIDRLALLRASLESGDVIGVKLYPPMGFAALGNTDRSVEEFPDALNQMTGDRPGAALDSVMSELFSLCSETGVPVMAHCGQSNGSRKAYQPLAGPAHWEVALVRFPELRLNLGHFGGIWDLDDPLGDPRSWAKDIVRLMRTYPNVYADVGYFGSVLDDDPAPAQATARFIAELADQVGSPLRKRLMYGSDWSMIGQEQGVDRYPGLAVRALAGSWPGEAEEDLRWRNAASFLGLGKTDSTRQRLEALYVRKAIDPAPLRAFDPA